MNRKGALRPKIFNMFGFAFVDVEPDYGPTIVL